MGLRHVYANKSKMTSYEMTLLFMSDVIQFYNIRRQHVDNVHDVISIISIIMRTYPKATLYCTNGKNKENRTIYFCNTHSTVMEMFIILQYKLSHTANTHNLL